jgi:putative hydrolase of the HAD superfamily
VLKAVTFDLWWTLIRETPEGSVQTKLERIRKISQVLRSERINPDRESLVRAYDMVGEKLEALWQTYRDIGASGQVEWILDILQVPQNAPCPRQMMDRLVKAYTLPILSALPVPLDGAVEVLAKLEERGLRMAVICNTGRTPGNVLRIILERLNLARFLSVQTFSDEVGIRKPRPEIFERALSDLGVKPSEALHVGDTLESDVVGARAIGMRAVHLRHPRVCDTRPIDSETIHSLPELLELIEVA